MMSWSKKTFSPEGTLKRILAEGRRILVQDERLRAEQVSPTEYTLTISPFFASDIGTYECAVTVDNTSLVSDAPLFICL